MTDVIEAMARAALEFDANDLNAIEASFAREDERDLMRFKMRAALSAALERGWVLVPKEPTRDQTIAPTLTGGEPYNGPSPRMLAEIYRTMVAASPEVK